MDNQRRIIIIKSLQNLVHKRYSYEKLNEILCNMFGVADIYVSETNAEEDNLIGDYNMEFSITKPIIGGVFDIYYLPMKNKGVIYITEVGYMFDM